MPRLSDSMEEGTISAWLLRDGARVERGQPLVEIETDKATVVYEAEATGYLRVVVRAGETAAVGTQIAELLAEPGNGGLRGHRHRRPAGAARRSASPVARRLAVSLGIELAELAGTGPSGRIVKRDVLAARPGAAAADAAAPLAGPGAKGRVTRERPSRLQQVLARRMSESKATAPEFAVTIEIDMTATLELRRQIKAQAPGDAPSVNDMLVKACALALREHPRCNGTFADGSFEFYERINIGVAVAGQDALIVPVVADADRRALGEIARETRELARAVRDGSITPAQLDGATFTLSNLGMYGVSSFTAVINPPQAAILAVGAITRRPVFDEHDHLVARELMSATLVSDHRLVYGAHAAAFLATLRDLLGAPLRLLV